MCISGLSGDFLQTTMVLGGKIFFERSLVTGYGNLEEENEFDCENEHQEQIINSHSNGVAKINRKKFKLIDINNLKKENNEKTRDDKS